jgi:peptidoglycan pentaglycine glycine transferase (the first glycine)
MKHRVIADRRAWNDALLTLPAQHVMQSWDWGVVKSKHNWLPTRLLWEQAGHPVAAAQVLRRPVPHTPWSLLYVPKGPSLDYTDLELVEGVLDDLEGYARAHRSILIKIDPDVNGPQIARILASRGWRYSAQQIQFRNTALLDLTPPEEDLLSAMKSKTRYNVRLSRRRGVEVRAGELRDIPRFYEMYAETGKRDGFLTRPYEYYNDVWHTFLQAGLAHMLLAQVGPETVAGLILFRYGDRAWYMYGASAERHREKMPNYALQWSAILWAKSRGCTTYDLWGAPDALEESDPMWGVWRFKEGFGAEFTPHIGAYDLPGSRLVYWAYTVALPKYLAALRQRD